jgi:hypothetical protein
MNFQSEWNTFRRRKYNVIYKSSGIGNEHFFFSEAFEIEKAILVKYTIFLVLCALYKLFCVFPSNWTEILELRKTCLQNASIIMNILNFTWPLRRWNSIFIALCPNKFLLCRNICLYHLQCAILHIPFAFFWINFLQRVINILIKSENMHWIWFILSQSLSKNCFVRSKNIIWDHFYSCLFFCFVFTIVIFSSCS